MPQKGFLGTSKVSSTYEVLISIKDARWALLAPVVILGGIYSGIFTPTEASVVAVNYALFIGLFIYKELDLSKIYSAILQAVIVGGTVTVMVGLAGTFGRILTQFQIPQQLSQFILDISLHWFLVLMIINIALIIIGTFMETLATIILVTPLLLPVVTALGISPIHFGILIVITSEIGFLTPPLGANLFVAMPIAKVTLEQISKAVFYFIGILFLMVIILTAIPELSTWLPKILN